MPRAKCGNQAIREQAEELGRHASNAGVGLGSRERDECGWVSGQIFRCVQKALGRREKLTKPTQPARAGQGTTARAAERSGDRAISTLGRVSDCHMIGSPWGRACCTAGRISPPPTLLSLLRPLLSPRFSSPLVFHTRYLEGS